MAVVEVQVPSFAPANGDQVVDCVWFEGKTFVRGKFPSGSLEAMCCPVAAAQAA